MPVNKITRPALRYHGGKWRLSSWIVSHFPEHRIYVEPYGGAASVLLRKQRSYAEIYNDMDGEIVNMFRVLRNPAQARELIRLIKLTPFAREEFENSYLTDGDPIDQARRTIVRSFMGFGSAGATGKNTGFRNNSNRSGTTPAHDWMNYPPALELIAERMRGVVVENRPAIQVMQKFDGLATLHYVDPPYPLSTRGRQTASGYRHEMTDDQHTELAGVLKSLKGMVILSGYLCPLYAYLYEDWQRVDKASHADGALDVGVVTHRTYKDRVRCFRQWWARVGPTVYWRLTQSLLEDFEVHLRTKPSRFGGPMTYLTRYMTIRVIRQMFIWASTTGKTDKNYGLWLPFPSGDPPKRKSPKPEHLARLMLAAAESPQALRDQTIIAFLIGTGCRRAEVAGLRVEDLTIMADGSGTATVIGKRTKANPTGIRDVGFAASTGKWLVRYLDETGIVAGSLWPIGFWGNLGPQGIYLMVKRTITRAGLDEVIQGPHDLRRAFATILGKMHRDAPAWADLIRRQLGHKHYSQTTDYILDDAEDIRDRIVDPLDQ